MDYEYKKGKKEKAMEIAKKMIKKGMEIPFLIEITGLTEEEIEILQKEIEKTVNE